MAVLSARELRRSFPQPGKPPLEVLRGVSLEVEEGQLAAILGPSGSGKSTLLHMLGLMDRPDSGEILLHGRPTRSLPEAERAKLRSERVGFVFQFDSMLPEFTMLENVAMPGRILGRPPEECESRARELLAAFGLGGLADRFPRETSGGERQRAALARSLLNRPGLVLADEPTGNLDRPNRELVFKDLRRLADEFGVAVLLVTHDERAAEVCHRIVHLLDGRLTEEGR